MDPDAFRRHAHELVDWMVDYLARVGELPVTPPVRPGDIRARLPSSPPEAGEQFGSLFQDFRELIIPGMTHWNHPGWFAYFPGNNSPPSVLGEMLTATMGAQCMSWVTSPAATELEQVVMDWLRQMVGLPGEFVGSIQDTASTATLVALLSAREHASGGAIGVQGWTGGPALTVYASREAHSSVDKGVKLAGFGLERLRRIATDAAYGIDPTALEREIERDVAAGLRPACVVASIGTTSSTAVDPVGPIAAICRRHGIWLHVDAAYAGSAAIVPELRDRFHGWELADSIVLNPHKWLLTNFDCSAYYVRDPDALLSAFSLTPEYLRTAHDEQVVNYRDRQTRTLSGGEAQRISLSNALGARLVDTLYVLDEPSVGLHPRDTDRLLSLLRRLRDGGNTVVVVEHDLSAIQQADFMLELGPGSGEHGGRVVHAGPVAAATQSLTGQYLTGQKRIAVPSLRRPAGPLWLRVRGATLHNLRGVDVDIPLGALTAVTGVSGSGKSTLLHDVIYRHLEARLHGGHSAKSHLGEEVGRVESLSGWEFLKDALLIDQSPIGRSPRSNPITYIKAFDEIRELFAAQPLARQRKYSSGTFSFNMPGGRCEECEGAGHVQVEMVFLADVFVPCEACGGRRYRRDVLDVRIQGHSIHDVLQWTVEEAIARFRHQPKLGTALWHLQQVGLGYLRLGQPATTLSGGEAQRLKIARELIQAGKREGRKLYILDEPTTGLHLDDVRVLIQVLDRLVDAGHTVVVIEHHLDVIKRADWIVDLGPEAGDGGGRVVAQGLPEAVADCESSHTGRYLHALLPSAHALAG